ncbi:MAG: conserved transrane protein [Caulobacteraceae bacterium]|nr:conserved transrane protein [Caulobacteraceae bacterium]
MAKLSTTSAFAAGFRLIGRAPLAPLIWGALNGLAILPIQAIQLIYVWPNMLRGYGQMIESSRLGQPLPASAFTQSPGMTLLPLLFMPLVLFIWAMVGAAATRAVLEPQDRRFFYLRLGKQELWLMLVLLVQVILFYVGLIIMMILGIGVAALVIGLAVASHIAPLIVIASLAGVAAGFALPLSVLWVLMRFSLAGPMTVHDREFRLFESWQFTKGNGWKLVGLAVLLVFAMIGFEILFFGAIGAIGLAFGFSNIERLQEALSHPEDWMGQALPVILIALSVFTIAGGYFSAIFIAPFADAYDQIRGRRAAEEVF